jgi:putative transposase
LQHLELATGISTERTIDGDGVFFQYLRYNSPELQDYCRQYGRKFRTEVRFNPDDLGFMNVRLPKAQEWLPVPLQRPAQTYGAGLSLLQHQINRIEAGERLNRRNAEEELMKAEQRNRDRWSEAIRVGVKVRKHSDLIRQQGLTSAKLFQLENNPSPTLASQMEVSPIAANLLPEVVPFKSFTLNEELE